MSLSPSSPYLPSQRLDVLDRRRLERLEAVALEDVADHADDVLAAADVFGQEIPHPAGRACLLRGHQRVYIREKDHRGIRGSYRETARQRSIRGVWLLSGDSRPQRVTGDMGDTGASLVGVSRCNPVTNHRSQGRYGSLKQARVFHGSCEP